MRSVILIVLSIYCLFAVSKAAVPADYLITSLPGLEGPFPTFKQYSGYITVNETTGKNMFFWFNEAVTNPANSPVVVWLQGGPGCSSLLGMALENGPYHPTLNPAGTVTPFPYSWNRIANTLYIESPAGVGFSYSNTPSDYNTGDNQTAYDNYIFLQKWFQVFTTYQSNDLWITGESYGGVYIPTLTYNILLGQDTRLKQQLKGLMLGNPVIDCPQYGIIVNPYATQMSLYYWHAMIPYRTYRDWVSIGCGEINPPDQKKCATIFEEASNMIGQISGDDLYLNFCTGNGTLSTLEKTPNCVTPDDVITAWYNRADVKNAIHAKASITWSECTSNINYTMTNPDILDYLTVIFREKPSLNILYYSGDVDIATVPFAFTQECLYQLRRPLVSQWKPWYLPGTNSVAGYVEAFDRFTYATIKGAGHEVPEYQPAEAYYVFENFLKNQRIPNVKPAFAADRTRYKRVKMDKVL